MGWERIDARLWQTDVVYNRELGLALSGGPEREANYRAVEGRGCTDRTKWKKLAPPEMLAGLKMNINFPIGNGLDDSGNARYPSVDGPAETTSQSVTLSGAAVSPISFDGITAGTASVTYYYTSGTVSAPATSQWARQLEARYLYVLACLTSNMKYRIDRNSRVTKDATATTTLPGSCPMGGQCG